MRLLYHETVPRNTDQFLQHYRHDSITEPVGRILLCANCNDCNTTRHSATIAPWQQLRNDGRGRKQQPVDSAMSTRNGGPQASRGIPTAQNCPARQPHCLRAAAAPACPADTHHLRTQPQAAPRTGARPPANMHQSRGFTARSASASGSSPRSGAGSGLRARSGCGVCSRCHSRIFQNSRAWVQSEPAGCHSSIEATSSI